MTHADLPDRNAPAQKSTMNSVFRQCRCGLEHFERIPRRYWMRFLPGLRFYRCSKCGKQQLASQQAVTQAGWLPRQRNNSSRALQASWDPSVESLCASSVFPSR